MSTKPRRRILLIDDDTSLLTTLGDFLRFEGYEVVTAESGEEGLRKLADAAPDLIILDMSMPGMGGMGFLKAITRPNGTLSYPVLVLTARANMAEFFADVDVEGFIAKPCDPNDLLLEVGRILFLRRGDRGASSESGSPAKRKILLGEDDALVHEALSRALTREGFVVDGAFKGTEVIEKAILGRPDVILIKRGLENPDGDAVAALLADMDRARSIPLILYDESEAGADESPSPAPDVGPRRRVYGNDPAALIAAVRDVLAT